jgi:hypothetical protein
MARSVAAIKRKYGANAFSKWGAKGGSPVLRAWKSGRIPKSLVKSK